MDARPQGQVAHQCYFPTSLPPHLRHHLKELEYIGDTARKITLLTYVRFATPGFTVTALQTFIWSDYSLVPTFIARTGGGIVESVHFSSSGA